MKFPGLYFIACFTYFNFILIQFHSQLRQIIQLLNQLVDMTL